MSKDRDTLGWSLVALPAVAGMLTCEHVGEATVDALTVTRL